MDPLTQGAAGVVAAQSASGHGNIRAASLAGLTGGMLPDADIFLHIPDAPLTNLLIHRHFTHSLIFIPLGGLIAAVLAWFLLRRKQAFSGIYLFATLGYATGGLLDACTTYGTHLYWPFSSHRAAWDVIAIIDPAFTLTLAAALACSLWRRTRLYALIGLVAALSYLAAGAAARHTAAGILAEEARHRGHTVLRLRVMPTIGNLVLWRGIYEAGDKYHVAAVRLGLLGPHRVYSGTAVERFRLEEQNAERLSPNVLADIRRFSHFADGYLFAHQRKPLVLGDLRYSLLPNRAEPLWALVIDREGKGARTDLVYYSRISGERIDEFWRMLAGTYP
jgi:inner membrane protein